jgi:hypothetical protein
MNPRSLPDLLHIFLLLVFSGLIMLCARGDLWFDEIWSLGFATSASSIWDIFSLRHDNNHPLNTLYLYLVGDTQQLYLYRLMSIASGVGSLLLAGLIGRRWGRIEGLLCLILFGFSYPLLLYFSEARGYSTAIFFSLLAYYTLLLYNGILDWTGRGVFWTSICLGVLGHATFIMPLLGMAFLSLCYRSENSGRTLHTVIQLVYDYALPGTLLLLYYVLYLADIAIGGGPVYSWGHQFTLAAGYLLGIPAGIITNWIAAAILILVVGIGCIDLYKKNDPNWLFFVIVIIVSPLLLVWLTQPTYFYFRYILLTFPFFYILLALLLARLIRSNEFYGKAVAAAVLILFLAGQSLNVEPLLRQQRGSYQPLVDLIAKRSTAPVAYIASDHDFRNRTLFNFYKGMKNYDRELVYLKRDQWSQHQPHWFISHHLDAGNIPPHKIRVSGIGIFDLIYSSPAPGNSGWNWYLYEASE